MIISIESNIAGGKSTQLNLLKYISNFNVIEEDVELWVKEGWLEKYYSDIRNNSVGFQLRVLKSHSDRLNKIDNNKINIIERNPITCLNIFGKFLLKTDKMDQLEYDLMIHYSTMINLCVPDYIIYIRTSTDICYERLKGRNRKSEDLIPLRYLEMLGLSHDEEYLDNINNIKSKIIVIDGNQDVNRVNDELLSKINALIAK